MKIKLVLAGCIGFAVCMAQGALVTDNFETYADGSDLGGQGSWTAGDAVVTSGQESPFDSGGSQSAHINTTSTCSSNFTAEQNELTVTFDLRLDNYNANPGLSLISSGGTQAVYFRFALYTGSAMRIYNAGSGWTDVTTENVAVDTWYRIQLVNDIVNDNTDVSVWKWDGSSAVSIGNGTTDFSFRNAVSDIDEVRFEDQGGGVSTYYIDDVSVIPEPATLGLVGLISLGLLATRRLMI